jgi:hypothetical protein
LVDCLLFYSLFFSNAGLFSGRPRILLGRQERTAEKQKRGELSK